MNADTRQHSLPVWMSEALTILSPNLPLAVLLHLALLQWPTLLPGVTHVLEAPVPTTQPYTVTVLHACRIVTHVPDHGMGRYGNADDS